MVKSKMFIGSDPGASTIRYYLGRILAYSLFTAILDDPLGLRRPRILLGRDLYKGADLIVVVPAGHSLR
jgi:hypothetical protein